MSLGVSLSAIYPNAVPGRDFMASDYGAGPFLSMWNETALGPRPSDAAIAALIATPIIPHEHVDAERDRRMAAMPFGGKTYQFNAESQGNIAGAGTLALAAIISGAQAGNYRWASPDADFVWLAMDNTATPMDAQTMLAFAQAAASWKREHIYAARVIKDLSPIPADYAAAGRWPD